MSSYFQLLKTIASDWIHSKGNIFTGRFPNSFLTFFEVGVVAGFMIGAGGVVITDVQVVCI